MDALSKNRLESIIDNRNNGEFFIMSAYHSAKLSALINDAFKYTDMIKESTATTIITSFRDWFDGDSRWCNVVIDDLKKNKQ